MSLSTIVVALNASSWAASTSAPSWRLDAVEVGIAPCHVVVGAP
jgi:hypothetical protein